MRVDKHTEDGLGGDPPSPDLMQLMLRERKNMFSRKVCVSHNILFSAKVTYFCQINMIFTHFAEKMHEMHRKHTKLHNNSTFFPISPEKGRVSVQKYRCIVQHSGDARLQSKVS